MFFAPGECTEEEFMEYELDRDSDGLYGVIQREMKQDDEEKERHFYGEVAHVNKILDTSKKYSLETFLSASFDDEIPF